MIFKSFILGNLVSLCMKIINSVVVVGLYYGFLTTFSMGPSYLFLLRTRVIEEGERGTEKKVSATTGFITGQLVMFISIYYAPLHLALGRPHTITVLALPYLLFHFFWNNHKHFFDYGSTTRNSMRNLSIQCVFLNNLIFQLFNHFILPSSMLVRLVNIYMFRCNNKMLFVTSSFVGWLIGHILFMKWVGLILLWIQQNKSIRTNVLIRSNKYLVSELRNSMARIFSILLFITCVYSLGRMPSPIFTKKLKETSETEEREEERDVEIETTSETKGTKQEQEGSTEEDPSSSLFSEEKEDPDKIDETGESRVNGKEKTKDEFHFHFKETCYKNRPVYETFYLDGNQENSKLEILIDKKDKDKDLFWFEKPLVTILFDYKRWNRPFRYIKNDQFENAVRREMSQYFFYTCQSDGKERISFTYPPSLETFLEMMQKKISPFTTEKLFSDELYNHWNYNNEQKKKNLSDQFLNRMGALDRRSLVLNTVEKRTRLYTDETKKGYLPKIADPSLCGSYRRKKKNSFLASIINETSIKNCIETLSINKFILFILNNQEFNSIIHRFNRNLTKIGFFFYFKLINENKFTRKSNFNFKRLSLVSDQTLFPDQNQEKTNSKNRIKIFKFFFDAILMEFNNKTIRKNSTGIKEISKQVPRWSYKLIDDLEQQEGENEENVAEDHEIRSRKAKHIVIFTNNHEDTDTYNNRQDTTNPDHGDEVALIRYSQQSDFRRDIIKGSMRTQRRKTSVWKIFQANVHSPLFLDRIDKSLFFSFDISELIKRMFRNWMCKNKEFSILDLNSTEQKRKESEKKEENKREEKSRIEIAEAWDSILLAQVIRGCLLVTQSILRKYILLPSLIIGKNIIRMLLFQFPEWSEDFKDWSREMHIKCTYNGVQLSEREFPKNWLTDGIQIKILFPFRLKPWHRSKSKFPHKDPMKKKGKKNDFCFLTVWGMETELPFGSPRKRFSLVEPLLKKLETKILKLKKNSFLVLTILKKRIKFFLKLSKERANSVMKKILFLKVKEITSKLPKGKRNKNNEIGFKEVYELDERQKEKDSIINIKNSTIQKLSTQTSSIDWINHSVREKKMIDLTVRTKTITNQIEKITKEKKKSFIISERNSSPKKKKINYNAKIKLKSSKSISKILKKINVRLVRKLDFFIKILIEKIYIDIFLGIINIPKVNAQLFLESRKKFHFNKKYISNNEETPPPIDKTNKKKMNLISILKRLLKTSSFIQKNSQIFCDISSLSQAYVFYKLSQIQVINLHKLRSVLKYHGTYLFLKNEIKDYFEVQGLFYSDLKDTKFRNSVMNQWKNWLRNHYQYKYDFYQIKWSRLIPQKWRNKINQVRMVQNKDLKRCNFNLYEKDQLIHYKKKKDFETNSLLKKKNNFKKQYRYDLLSYKCLNYEDKRVSPISKFPLKENKISYNYNREKRKFFDILCPIPINNYLAEDNIINMEKNPKRKYFDWRILYFCLKKKVDIESWIDSGTSHKINTKTKQYQIIDRIDNKDLFFLTIPQVQEVNSPNQKVFFDWMEMNEKIINHLISNFELWFFHKFWILCKAYKKKPWVIPTKLLLLNFNGNKTVSENKKINRTKTGNLFLSRSPNEKKSIEFENQKHEEKESEDQVDLESVLTNQEKDFEEDYADSDMKKRKKKKKYKSNTEAELDFFLKRYLLFNLRWDDSLNQKIINNIKVYCLLLRLKNPREIIISSIQRGEISLDILMIQKYFTLSELMKKGILVIEPLRLSVKNDGQFIMYQTLSLLLVHKSKQQINQRRRAKKKNYIDKKNLTEAIERYRSITINRDTNDYDLLVPENLLSPKCRRELRIRISLNSKNRNASHINTEILKSKNIKRGSPFFYKSKDFDRDKKKLTKLKLFLWPNYRLEDLACMNRYWFDTNNASRFSMVRIHIYPHD
uniref:Protein TIC 214 n=1 Tax=Galphimia angustifolia TaxID=1561780 RepID=A0A4Y5PPQ0_9ROSI|nr:Ycf1 protein [Galphimia angustifolia]QCW94042.1 Ycf1 protein [Galphimia angustifolia]